MDVYQSIIELLNKQHISYKTFSHEAVLTSEQAAKVRGNKLEQGAKAMLLRSEGTFVLAVISAAKQIDMKKMKNILDTKSLSFATPEEVMKITGCEIGAVPPFGNLFDIPVYCDVSIQQQEKIDFNAGLRTHSIEVKSEEYIALVHPKVAEFAKSLS
jgi:Ala-tRNA(Pro) deacylase